MRPFPLALILISVLTYKVSVAQVCSSGLGDPIVNVTFGSGTDTYGPALASGTTNLVYGQNSCPNQSATDVNVGGYAIVHSPGVNCFGGDWVNFTGDHTGDVNGYFMLINASTNPNIFYTQQVDGLCQSTSYQFSAWVINMASHYGELQPDIVFTIEKTDGTVLQSFDTGPVPINNPARWLQYAFYFTTPPGVTSVILSMKNNGPGGYGNDLGLDDITFRTSGPSIAIGIDGHAGDSVDLCANAGNGVGFTGTVGSCYASNTYQWQQSTDHGGTWTDIPGAISATYSSSPTSPGSYLYRLTAAQAGNIGNSQCRVASGVDSIVVLPTIVPGLSIALDGNHVCADSTTLFTATPTPAGTAFQYQWMLDGNPVAATGATYNTSSLVTNDYVQCQVTSNYACASPRSALSNTITVTVLPDVVSSVSIGTTTQTTCKNDIVSFTASPATTGSTPPSYQWLVNSQPVGGNTPVYSSGSLNQGDQVSVVMSSGLCSNPMTSNTIVMTVYNYPNTGFAFVQQACDPLQVQFTGTAAPGLNYVWTVDGTTTPAANPAVPDLQFTFPGYGSHVVTLSSSVGGYCPSTTSENILVALTPANIIQTADTGICIGQSVPLSTLGGLGFCWSPTTGLDDPTSTHPTATPAVTTKYHFNSLITGNNLIVNGDFSAGNTAFTSAYTFATDGSPAGVYSVGPNSGAWLPGSPGCTDHTSGTGNMLLVNGAQQTDVAVWSETVAVTPNTNYAFSAWLDNITTVNPAILKFSINGQPLGMSLTANATPCVWNQFYTTWNSGGNTTATISIVNENTILSGNDFALDDISFAPVNIETDSVTIDVETPSVTVTPVTSTVCPGVAVPLQASGSLNYSWSPSTGLNDPTIANPSSLLPKSSSESTVNYTVTGTSARGCTATATSTVTVFPESLTLGPEDSLICKGSQAQLYATGAAAYSWTPAASLTDPASATPVATLLAPTEFYLSAVDANNCTEQDSLFIGIRPMPTYAAPPDESVCAGFGVKLMNQNGPGYVYSWSPGTGLDSPSAPSPVASPAQTITYTLDISDSTCAAYDSSFAVEVTVMPDPVITVQKDHDINCSVHSAQLEAVGALYYTWFPATGLNSPNTPAPVATLDSTTTYIVKGTGSNGCYAYDSVTVAVTATGDNTFVVPNAFTPNGDGHNDRFGVQRWGDVQLEEMVIYNRWGNRVFATRNPADEWDGTFGGQQQPAGAYPYVIRAHTFCGLITRTGVVMLVR